MAHTIRLRGPWNVHLHPNPSADVAAEKSLSPMRLTMPCTIADLVVAGASRLRLERRFQQPTGLTDQSQVWLCLRTLVADESNSTLRVDAIALNEKAIFAHSQPEDNAEHMSFRHDIRRMLQPSNTLEITVRHDGAASPGHRSVEETEFGDVWLEIID